MRNSDSFGDACIGSIQARTSGLGGPRGVAPGGNKAISCSRKFGQDGNFPALISSFNGVSTFSLFALVFLSVFLLQTVLVFL